MTLSGVFVLFSAAFIFSLFIKSALLWVTVRWLKGPPVTLRRSVLAALAIQTVWVALGPFVGFFDPKELKGSGSALFFVAYLLLVFVIIKWSVRAKVRKTVGITLVWLVLAVMISEGGAMVLRWKVLEAFQLTTGSMAPTLIGTHVSVDCKNCGQGFNLAIPLSASGVVDLTPDQQKATIPCAICGAFNVISGSKLDVGDRICIDKTVVPRRWDAIAFRCPWDTNTIYLQRLVGLPGEKIEILGGDVFANGKRVAKPPGVAEDMWIAVDDTAHRSPSAGKPEVWRAEPPDGGWTPDSKGWRFSGVNSQGEAKLEFTSAITDQLTYNSIVIPHPKPENVGDVKVETIMDGFSGSGYFGFGWTFNDRHVQAIVKATGDVSLQFDDKSVAGHLTRSLTERQVVCFEFRDGQAFVSQDGRIAAKIVVMPEESEAFQQLLSVETQPCTLALMAQECDLVISRISVARDVHYKAMRFHRPCRGCTGAPVSLNSREHYVLGDNVETSFDSRYWNQIAPEFKSRYELGTVPSELLLGPLRMVFWPPGRWRFFPPGQ